MAQKNVQISYRSVAAFGLGVTAVLLMLLVANLAGASAPSSVLAAAAPPQMVNYQGTVEISGVLFDGTGFFKFALVDSAAGDGSGNLWANDGTASGEPSQTVPLTVAGGIFNIMLGDTTVSGMTDPLTDAAFSSGETYLRIWFSQELAGPFNALEPNQRVSSVPYALRSSHAVYAETGAAMVPAGAVMFFDSASCPSGWSELTQARGRAVVGLPASGSLAATVGTQLTNLEDRAHTHAVNPAAFNSGSGGSHSHTTGNATGVKSQGITTGGFQLFYTDANHTHSTSTDGSHTHSVNVPNTTSTGASTSDVMPYIQLLACKKS